MTWSWYYIQSTSRNN